jgi:beta-glucanase (GH16 family)
MKFAKLGSIAFVSALALLGAPATAASQTCFGHRATIVGTDGDDHLVGTPARDVIVAGRGHDHVRSRQGNDLVCGGPGSDELFLGRGADKANADRGADFVDGARGSDSIWGGAGRDLLRGLFGGPGRDRLYGGQGRDFLHGGHGDDLMRAGPGDDLMEDDAAISDDRFLGGPGSDGVRWKGRRAVIANLTSGLARGHGRDILHGIESLSGTPSRDRLVGNARVNNLKGFEGDDHIQGRDGQDVLDGGEGTDLLDGGAGSDTCRLGEDVLNCEGRGFDWAAAAWDESHHGKRLDLTGYTNTFVDNFNSLSTITDGRSGSGPWYAPARPDTSLAHFLSPSETPTTFSIDPPGVLTITMQKVGASWYSGHIQTVNKAGDGFAQRYGYFEARMAFQRAVSWPAFWLYSRDAYDDSAQTRAEIDVIEAYGDNDYDGYHMSVHRHAAQGSDVYKSNYVGLSKIPAFAPGDLFDGNFHRYGCLVRPDYIAVYFDRVELARFQTYPEAKLPLYMLVSLQMQDGFVAQATSPTRLRVDYVRAYALPR